MASTIFSQTLRNRQDNEDVPSSGMMTRAAWKAHVGHAGHGGDVADDRGKEAVRAIPGAIAKGLLTRNAMQNVPMADAMQVARTRRSESCPAAPEASEQVRVQRDDVGHRRERREPATTSVLTVVLFSELENFL